MKPSFSEAIIFGFSRFLAFIGALFFLILFLTALMGYFFYKSKENHVNLREFYSLVSKEKKSTSITLGQLRLDPLLPEKVEQYLKGENREILYEWMSGMDVDERRDFLGNLALVIEEAESKNLDLALVINEYKNLKLSKMKKTSFEKILEKDVKLFFSAILIVSASFIVLFGCVLAILSLEKRIRD